MAETFASAVLPADVAAVWSTVRDFDGLPGWQPAVADSVLGGGDAPDRVGALRTLRMADGSTVVERLVALDDHDRRLTYQIVEAPYPVRFYRGSLRVTPVSENGGTPAAFVEWTIVYDCEAADENELAEQFHSQILAPGLRGLAEHLSAAASVAGEPPPVTGPRR